jgi:hypothetical protein
MVAIPGRSSQSGRPAHRLSRPSRLMAAFRPRTVRHAAGDRLIRPEACSRAGSGRHPSWCHVRQRVDSNRWTDLSATTGATRMATIDPKEVGGGRSAVPRSRQRTGACRFSPHGTQIRQEHHDQRARTVREAGAVPDRVSPPISSQWWSSCRDEAPGRSASGKRIRDCGCSARQIVFATSLTFCWMHRRLFDSEPSRSRWIGRIASRGILVGTLTFVSVRCAGKIESDNGTS